MNEALASNFHRRRFEEARRMTRENPPPIPPPTEEAIKPDWLIKFEQERPEREERDDFIFGRHPSQGV